MPDRAIFFDRDDTLIEDTGYINDPDQVKLVDRAAEALVELRAMGYKLIVASNQSAVARGIITEEVLGEIHGRLKKLLGEKGAYLDKIYYCPYHPEGVIPKYRKESNLRKPNPGMLLKASEEMDIDLSQSWLIGDSTRDIRAGSQAGCKTILIKKHSEQRDLMQGGVAADFEAVNLREAVNIIKKYHRTAGKISKLPETEAKIKEDFGVTEKQENSLKQFKEPQENTSSKNNSGQHSKELLSGILEQLKTINRQEMFGEFSIMRLLAGVVQIIVLFCLLLSVWFLMSPTRQDNSVFLALGFAMVLQLMSLTLYLMQGRK
ncbi:D-glycero-alpha-D-manno-heptose-1,7-bisphosphate 7-phosphatase [Planctomycetota bacterium]